MRLRHVGSIVIAAALLSFIIEPLVFAGQTPLVGRLDPKDRTELYRQVTTVSAGFLGFLITAVAILVSFDVKRQIVKELHRGEAFSLLIVNLLAAVALLLATTVLGIAAAVFDDGASGSGWFESIWQAVLLASTMELLFGLFYFALVTYKVATYE